MHGFRIYLEGREEDVNLQDTLRRLPAAHRAMALRYRYRLQPGNTLRGDDDNVGELDPRNKVVTVAGPWRYGREFTVLHEIGHLVWERLRPEQKKHWQALAAPHLKKLGQNSAEEAFAMLYAQAYAANKLVRYDVRDLVAFVKRLTS